MPESLGARFVLTAPPVTRVRITIFFDEIPALKLSQLTSLIEALRPSFPQVMEGFPIPVVRDHDGESVMVNFTDGFPLPLVTMTAESGNQELSFQSDRFSASWTFHSEGGGTKNYPGYESLRGQLREAFTAFETHVRSAGFDLKFSRAQCLYHNEIQEIPASGASLYLLTGREDLTARELFEERTYAGVRVRFPIRSDQTELRVSAGVDSEDETSSDLWIKVTASTEGQDDAFVVLDAAHDQLIEQFIAYTPAWLRAGWGERNDSRI